MAASAVIHDTEDWLERRKSYFVPPVCNYMMHKEGHLKVFFVGGPNVREDYHLEEGEELFYQLKGDMVLKVVEGGEFRDVSIKEGQLFLLPGRIPHSPQRFENTIGLVIERERVNGTEFDCLRYYVAEGNEEVLFERWFHCHDLGTQLPPVINEFMTSELRKTRKPGPGSRNCAPKYDPDAARKLVEPIYLADLLKNTSLDQRGGSVDVFPNHSSKVLLLGNGSHGPFRSGKSGEIFLWQFEGNATAIVNGVEHIMVPQRTLLVKSGAELVVNNQPKGRCMLVSMSGL